MARFSRSDFTLESFRRQLANVDALPQLCLLGLVSGIITGTVMVAFRLLLEGGAALGHRPGLHFAAMGFDKAFGDGQTQSRTASFSASQTMRFPRSTGTHPEAKVSPRISFKSRSMPIDASARSLIFGFLSSAMSTQRSRIRQWRFCFPAESRPRDFNASRSETPAVRILISLSNAL